MHRTHCKTLDAAGKKNSAVSKCSLSLLGKKKLFAIHASRTQWQKNEIKRRKRKKRCMRKKANSKKKKEKKASKTEMNTEKWNCIKKLKQVTTINKRLRRAQARPAIDVARSIVIGMARTELNKIARYFSRRNKVTISSRKEVKALIF